jgi:hypothetical protein
MLLTWRHSTLMHASINSSNAVTASLRASATAAAATVWRRDSK